MKSLKRERTQFKISPLIIFCCGLMLGIILYRQLSIPLDRFLSIFILASSCLFFFINDSSFKWAGFIPFLTLGYCLAQSSDPKYTIQPSPQQGVAFKIKVLESKRGGNSWNKHILTIHPSSQKSISPLMSYPRMVLYIKDSVLPQQSSWLVNCRISEIKNKGNPFEFNSEWYYKSKGIGYIGFINHPSTQLQFLEQEPIPFKEKFISYTQHNIIEKIQNKDAIGLANALLLGDKSYMNEEIYSLYQHLGIIHIIAISGAHVAILFSMIMYLFGGLFNGKLRPYSLIMILVIIWFYVWLSGMQAPALRAAIFFSLGIIGQLLKQRKNNWQLLWATAFIMLLLQPLQLFDIGFQLSFLAVLSITIFQPLLNLAFTSNNKIFRFIFDSISLSISAQVLIVPLLLIDFQQFSILFIIGNLIAGIASSALLGLCFLFLFIQFIPLLSFIIGKLIAFISIGLHLLLSHFASWHWEGFDSIPISHASTVFYYLSILLLILYVYKQQNLKFLWGSALAFLLCAGSSMYSTLEFNQKEKLYVLNDKKASVPIIIKNRNSVSIYDKHNWALLSLFKNNGCLKAIKLRTIDSLPLPNAIYCAIPSSKLIDEQIVIIDNLDTCDLLFENNLRRTIVLTALTNSKTTLQWTTYASLRKWRLHDVKKDGAYTTD